MMKTFVMIFLTAGMGLAAHAQTFPDKASKKNAKALDRSVRVTDANNAGDANKAMRQMDKMAKKADKVNKKVGKFK